MGMYLFLGQKHLDPKELLFVSFVMDIYGAMFREHCFNISREILFIQFLPLFSCSSMTSSL